MTTTTLVHGTEYEILDSIHSLRLCRATDGRVFVLDANDVECSLDDRSESVPFVSYEQPTFREMFARKAETIASAIR